MVVLDFEMPLVPSITSFMPACLVLSYFERLIKFGGKFQVSEFTAKKRFITLRQVNVNIVKLESNQHEIFCPIAAHCSFNTPSK